jgi:hypothetical protein
MHHIWWCRKGPAITWGQHKLFQTGKGCLGMWPWVSGTPVEYIFQERSPPWPSYGGTLRSTFLSLCLVKEGFSLGKLRKSSKPTTAVQQAIWGNSDTRWGIIPYCQWYMGGTWFQCTKDFFFFPLLKCLFSLSKSDPLKRRSKNSQWEGKFVFKPQKVFWLGHYPLSPKGWRCNFLTRPEAPKASKTQTPPAKSMANRQSDLLCFLHGFRGLRVEVNSCFQCSSTAFGQDRPGQQG